MKNNLPVSNTWRNSPFDEEGEEDFQNTMVLRIRRNLVAKFFMFDLFHFTSHFEIVPCA